MKIALVTDSYPPEIRSASHLMQELAEQLQLRGNEIYVLTTYPQYNLADEVNVHNLHEYSDENGIKVLRARTLPHHKVNFIIRGIAQLSMSFLLLRKLKKYIKDDIDAVIVYSPPVTLARIGAFLKAKYNARYILNVQDIFPQNAIELGVLRNKLVIRFFESIEKKAYAAADQIIVHSEGNKNFLLARKSIDGHKVCIVPNWVDIRPHAKAKQTGKFREKYGLKDKFIFLFAGVMGPSQGLDFMIKAAERVKTNPDIRFLFVGDGTEKQKLREMTNSYNLQNVVFAPFVSKQEYPELLKEVNVGLVCLTSRNKTPVVPGKILGYMAAGIPVVAFLQKESDAHTLIKDADCGYSIVHGDLENATKLIMKVYSERDKLEQLGTNGTKYVSQVFSIEKIVEKIAGLLRD